jgi:hypothetical protein
VIETRISKGKIDQYWILIIVVQIFLWNKMQSRYKPIQDKKCIDDYKNVFERFHKLNKEFIIILLIFRYFDSISINQLLNKSIKINLLLLLYFKIIISILVFLILLFSVSLGSMGLVSPKPIVST